MKKYNGNQSAVGRILGLHQTTVYYHLQRTEPEKIKYNDFIELILDVDASLQDPKQFGKDLRLAFKSEYGVFPEVIHSPTSSQIFHNMLE